MKGIIVAGTHSGVGKTTVATGIMAALTRRGCKVQPFKVGPDYIDPSHHSAVCGVPSHNLDTWLLEERTVVELFHRAMRDKELAVIEGVMGLYDGFQGESEEGSTAHVAKMLRLPVILVVDASAAARSVGASVLGFKNFDPEIKLTGIIVNGIAGERHLEFVRPALERAAVPLLGHLPKRPELALPERHLGLIPATEGKVSRELYDRLADEVERSIQVQRVLEIAAPILSPASDSPHIFPQTAIPQRIAVAVATDRAFNFYYPDSLDLLKAWGADIVPFSPLEDPVLPPSIDSVYIGGGFPELFARDLSENKTMLLSIRQAALQGLPIYAECGGLMYLGEAVEDLQGKDFAMVGILPCRTTMNGTRLTLGYRRVEALDDGPVMKRGESVRGHEFHLSALRESGQASPAYRVLDQNGRTEGFRIKNVLASYIHIHLGSKNNLAPNFVDFCVRCKRSFAG